MAINAFVFYLEVDLETPSKRAETRGKGFWKKTFQVRECKKAGMRKLKNTTLLRNNGALLSGLQRNALASLVHFAHNNVN